MPNFWKNRKSSKDSSNSDSIIVPKLDFIRGERGKNGEEDHHPSPSNAEESRAERNKKKLAENGEDLSSVTNHGTSSPITNKQFDLNISHKKRQIHYIIKEYEAVAKNPIEGIYITPGANSLFVWYGLLIIRTGIFYGGIFRFTLIIPENFPDADALPIVQFEDPLFHPLVNSKTNCIDLSRHFPSGWQRDRNHIYQVIIATQGIFFSCHCDSTQAANPEAAILLKENRTKFIQMARDTVRRSRTQVYAMPSSDDPSAIRFSPWDEAKMEPFRLYLSGKADCGCKPVIH